MKKRIKCLFIFLSLSLFMATPIHAKSVRQTSDAAVDRNILLPSAETIGKGKACFNSYELLFAGFTYGMTENSQVSVTTLLPVLNEMPLVMSIAYKLKLLDTERMKLSIQPSLTVADGQRTLGGSAILDVLLDKDGDKVVSAAFGTFGELGNSELKPGLRLVGTSVSYVHRLGDSVKLLTEVLFPDTWTVDNGKSSFKPIEDWTLFNYGVRFFGESMGFDITFLRPIQADAEPFFVMGIPYVAFSSRW